MFIPSRGAFEKLHLKGTLLCSLFLLFHSGAVSVSVYLGVKRPQSFEHLCGFPLYGQTIINPTAPLLMDI